MSRILCAELDASLIRLAVAETSGGRGGSLRIIKNYVIATESDAVHDGKAVVTDSTVAAFVQAFQRHKIQAKDIYFSVNSSRILFKNITLPYLKGNAIKSTIELQFTEHFPVEQSTYHISYMVRDTFEDKGQKKMSVDVYAIPNDLSQSYYDLAVALSLNIKGLVSSCASIVGLHHKASDERVVAYVDLGERSTSVTLVSGGNTILAKTNQTGIGDALNAVVKNGFAAEENGRTAALNCLYEQDILMDRLPDGSSDEAGDEANRRNAVTATLSPVLRGIESLCESYIKEGGQIQEFVIGGLGAGISGITHLISYEFGISANVIQRMPKIDVARTTKTLTIMGFYAPAGVAVSELNFLTDLEKSGGNRARKAKRDRIIFAAAFLAAAGLTGWSAFNIINANAKHSEQETKHSELTAEIKKYEDLGVRDAKTDYDNAMECHNQILAIYEDTMSGNEDLTTFLREVELTIPNTVYVQSIQITPDTAIIDFRGQDKYIVAGTLSKLRRMDSITSMEVQQLSIPDDDEDARCFQAVFTLKPAAEREHASIAHTVTTYAVTVFDDAENEYPIEIVDDDDKGEVTRYVTGKTPENIDFTELSDDGGYIWDFDFTSAADLDIDGNMIGTGTAVNKATKKMFKYRLDSVSAEDLTLKDKEAEDEEYADESETDSEETETDGTDEETESTAETHYLTVSWSDGADYSLVYINDEDSVSIIGDIPDDVDFTDSKWDFDFLEGKLTDTETGDTYVIEEENSDADADSSSEESDETESEAE